MNYQRGDVILVLFRPAVSGPQREAKRRPMVVVSSEAYHAERPEDVLAALVTTKVARYHGQTDYALQDWKAAGLRQPSTVRCTLAMIEDPRIAGCVGRLTERDMAGIDAALRRALGLQD